MSKIHRLLAVAVGVFALVAMGSVSTAVAQETARTTQRTKVLKSPGESSPLLLRVPAGTTVDVLARKGRFVKVRVNGRTGWVTRTSLQQPKRARGSDRDTRRRSFVDGRSRKRGWTGGAPSDRVGADAVDTDEPADAGEDSRGKRARGPSRGDDDDEFGDDDDDDDDGRRARRGDDGDGDDDDDDDDGDDGGKGRIERVVVTKRAKLYRKASTRSKAVATVRSGNELRVLDESSSGKWLRVENDDGDVGWIRASAVDASGGAAAMAGPRSIRRGGVTAGVAQLSQDFTSDGQGDLANYEISSAAASVALGAEYLYRYSAKYNLVADATYIGTRASPGIRFEQNGLATDIGFTEHTVRVGGAAGYNLRNSKGMVVYARAGYHFSKFGIHDVADLENNLARLPSEILQGVTAGAWLDVPRYSEKLGFRIGLDAIVFGGSREQTSGLQDGAPQDLFAAWGAATFAYQWKPNLAIQGGYRGAFATTAWAAAGASQRGNNATQSERTDIVHLLSVGVGRRF